MKNFLSRIDQHLNDLKNKKLFRQFSDACGQDFCSNDYLKLSHHPQIIQASIDAAKKFGCGSSSSRYIRGQRQIFCDTEKELAAFKKQESALVFSCGYMANVGALTSLIKPGDIVFSDQLNHASLIDGLRLSGAKIIIYPHLDLEFIERQIKNLNDAPQKFMVTESLFSMDGDVAPLNRFSELCEKNNIGLIVDESHAVALYGHKGSGLIDHFGINDEVLLSVNGLGKAFGCYGAFVAGKDPVVEIIKQQARSNIFTTALPPMIIAAIFKAVEIVKDANDSRKKLFDNINFFTECLAAKTFSLNRELPSPIFPLHIGENEKALQISRSLQTNGFDVRAIRPPTVPKKTARLRISLNVDHSQQNLCELVLLLGKLL